MDEDNEYNSFERDDDYNVFEERQLDLDRELEFPDDADCEAYNED